MKPPPEIVLARQAAPLDGFRYLITDVDGSELGEIQWPMYAQASNARLKVHGDDIAAGSVKVRCGQEAYLIQFEYLQRNWQNDTRYTLRSGDQILASASITFKEGYKRGVMSLELPFEATFVGRWTWFRKHFDLVSPDRQTRLGQLEEPSLIATSRQLRAELPGLTLPQQAFCLFLALHLIQTQF
jgi:hypothetical protein